MAKNKSSHIEVQKGPINLNEQYSYKFNRPGERTMNDMKNIEMREYGKTMEYHTPKQ